MTNIIKHKNNPVSGAIPAAENLSLGELAINTADGKLFTRTNAGTVIELTRATAVDGGEIVYDSLLNSLQAFWLFNNNLGTVVDVSDAGNGLHVAAASQTTTGVVDNSLRLAHKNFVYAKNAFAERRTVAFWLKYDAVPTQNNLFMTFGVFGEPGEASGQVSITSTGTLQWYEPAGLGQLVSSSAIAANTWAHIALVRTPASTEFPNGRLVIYVNGVLAGNATLSNNTLVTDPADVLTIGWHNADMPIDIDCLGIWNRALTQAEITKLYDDTYALPDLTATPIDPAAYINYSSNSPITSLSISVNGSTASIFPAFNTGIHDYGVLTNSATAGAAVTYTLVVNGTGITGTGTVNKLIRINFGSTAYYIRLLPSDMPLGTITTPPAENYIPAYYVATSRRDINAANYNIIYNEYGLPIWYVTNGGTPHLHQLGNDRNRTAVSRNGIGARYLMQISDSAIATKQLFFLPTTRNGNSYAYEFGSHELLEITSPPERRGNVVYNTFVSAPAPGSQAITDKAYGVYVQEQAPNGTIAWEWWTSDRFDQTSLAQNASFFHMNSVDVHPVTGDMLLSCRQCSAIVCVDYATKNVKWIIQGASQPWGNIDQTANQYTTETAQWLTLEGEPSIGDYQYLGPEGQHHAKWATHIDPLTPGNEVISVFDNQVGFFPGGGTITPKTVTALVQSGTTVTGTSTNHGFATGSYVKIIGADQSVFNGIFNVTVVNSSTFTYTVNSSDSQTATGTLRATRALTYFPHSVDSPAARGTVYEIDLTQNKAIHRSSAFAPNGRSGYLGSYHVMLHENGVYSHVLDFNQQHPQLVEYEDVDGNGTSPGDIIYAVDFPGDIYRITKVSKNYFDLDYLRVTAGLSPALIQ